MQQKRSKTRSPKVAQTGHWCTLSAALDEQGWPWLRLHGELVAGTAVCRTHPPGCEIDWGDPTLRIDRAESTVTFWGAPKTTGLSGDFSQDRLIVAVEVFLPVGQRPPTASIKGSWRDRVPEADLKSAMEDIAKSYDGKPKPAFNEVWSKLKDRFRPDFPRDAARHALNTYAPQLKRAPGDKSKVKSRS
jgi:hypothetical protein